MAGIAARKATKVEFGRMAPQVVDPNATTWGHARRQFRRRGERPLGSSRNCRT
jgi:hypothetical protein